MKTQGTNDEIDAIRKRARNAPGTWSADDFGAPVIRPNYGSRFIDRFLFKDPDVYVRQKRSETSVLDQLPRLQGIAQRIDALLADAYQAHRDVRTLLAEVDLLRAELAATRAAAAEQK